MYIEYLNKIGKLGMKSHFMKTVAESKQILEYLKLGYWVIIPCLFNIVGIWGVFRLQSYQ
jgi:hypothetical protein